MSADNIAQRGKIEAQDIWRNENFQVYCEDQEGWKELIIYVVGKESFPLLEKNIWDLEIKLKRNHCPIVG